MAKLVRDKIPEIIAAKNQSAKIKILEIDSEYLQALNDKLLEEVNELITSIQSNESLREQQSEVADVLEVVEAICKFRNYDNQLIKDLKKKKRLERGGFEKRMLLISKN